MIITADDFGYNKKINDAIIDACRKKTITRTSLLINAGGTKHAIMQYKKLGSTRIPIGLHFNITEGSPISKKSEIPSLVTAKGVFYPIHIFLARLIANRIRKEEVLIELDSQIRAFLESGLTLNHIDSHQNIHCFEPLYSIIHKTVIDTLGKNSLRSVKTCKVRLKKFPLKYIVFLIVKYIQLQKYPTYHRKKETVENKEEKIIHPGAPWD